MIHDDMKLFLMSIVMFIFFSMLTRIWMILIL